MKKLASKYKLDPLSIIILSKYHLIGGECMEKILEKTIRVYNDLLLTYLRKYNII